MSVPQLPYNMSSPEEALACLRKITKLIDEFCSDFNDLRSQLNKIHETNKTIYNSMVAQLQNLKLQMQPQAVPVSNISLYKVTSQKKLVSADLAPDLDPVQGIALVFSETSNHDLHTSRLQNQTRFVTPLSCDIEPEITKPTSRKIVVSYDLAPDLDPVQGIA